MAIIRWDPYRSLRGVEREFYNLFNALGSPSEQERNEGLDWYPAVDITENKDAYAFELELPGVSKEDVKVTIANDTLTIRGEKKEEKEIKHDNVHTRERVFGSFTRSFRIPGGVDADQVKAEYKDGILRLSLPKAEGAKMKQIEIH